MWKQNYRYYSCCCYWTLWLVTLHTVWVLQTISAFSFNPRYEATIAVPIITNGGRNLYRSKLFMTSNEQQDQDPYHNNDDDNNNDISNNEKREDGSSHQTNNNKRGRYFISKEVLEEIKYHADIVSVIEAHDVAGFVRQSDSRAIALCPFHDDTNPSMSIDNERGLYKCFACGAGGDVFQFIREYRHVTTTGQPKISYPQAIQIVMDEYLPPSIANTISKLSSSSIRPSSSSSLSLSSSSMEVQKKKRKKEEERMKLVHAAACDFYTKALVTSPLAGASRNHLRLRGIRPSTVTTFALGYAPDVYFSTKTLWGKGSLVETLQQLNFTPQEILNSGLATRIQKKKKQNNNNKYTTTQTNNNNNNNHKNNQTINNNNDEKVSTTTRDDNNNDDDNNSKQQQQEDDVDVDDTDYTTLMDRFRGRIMIPIFDKTGKYVIAFGGRHIDTPPPPTSKTTTTTSIQNKNKNKKFVAAKYINSPESLLFQKKHTLFGLNTAIQAMTETNNNNNDNNNNNNNNNDPSKTKLSSSPFTQQTQKRPLVIVEGYLDAITLYAAGIKEVVASMGTALTLKQLELAADCCCAIGSTSSSGNVILCLDNDTAGIHAVERICSGNILFQILDKYPQLTFLIATLPHGIKDPAEYIESKKKGTSTTTVVVDDFRTNVLDTAMDWRDWYIHHIIQPLTNNNNDNNSTSTTTNTNAEGNNENFADVCDRISTFLASFTNVADRTRRAYEAAGILSTVLTSGGTSSSGSSTLQIQLESDLLDMASRKATVREALSRRIEQKSGILSSSSSSEETISRLLNGGGNDNLFNELNPYSSSSINSRSRTTNPQQQINDMNNQHNSTKQQQQQQQQDNYYSNYDDYRLGGTTTSSSSSFRRNNNKSTKRNTYYQRKTEKPILPHFSGFHFADPNDAEWLGVTGNNKRSKQSLLLGQLPKERIKNGLYSRWKSDEAVYFNSNEYIGGRQYLNKPLLKEHMTGDNSKAVGLDVSDLMDESSSIQIIVAESQLLRSLVASPPARVAMKAAMTRNAGDHFLLDFDWSNQQREWLFQRLVEFPGVSPLPKNMMTNNATSMELRDYLRLQPDVPKNAFGKKSQIIHNNGQQPSNITTNEANNSTVTQHSTTINMEEVDVDGPEEGVLDEFFTTTNDDIFFSSNETEIRNKKIEFTVQETVATILKANAVKRLTKSKQHWKLAHFALLNKKEEGVLDDNFMDILSEQDKNMFQKYSEMDLNDLSLCCVALANDTNEAMKTAHELTESAKRIGRRMLDSCSSSDFEGRITSSKREELIKEMNEFVDSLPEDNYMPTSSGADGEYVFSSDSFDHEDSSYGHNEQPSNVKSVVENYSDSSNLVDERFVNFISSLPDNDLEMDLLDDDSQEKYDLIEGGNDPYKIDDNTSQDTEFLSNGTNDLDHDDIEPPYFDNNIFQ